MLSRSPLQPEPTEAQACYQEDVKRLVCFLQTGSAEPDEITCFINDTPDSHRQREALTQRVIALLSAADADGIGEKLRETIARLPDAGRV